MKSSDSKGMARAFIVTAEYDPFGDDGESYGKKLREFEVKTRISRYPGMIHGFYLTPGLIHLGNRAIDEVALGTERCFPDRTLEWRIPISCRQQISLKK